MGNTEIKRPMHRIDRIFVVCQRIVRIQSHAPEPKLGDFWTDPPKFTILHVAPNYSFTPTLDALFRSACVR